MAGEPRRRVLAVAFFFRPILGPITASAVVSCALFSTVGMLAIFSHDWSSVLVFGVLALYSILVDLRVRHTFSIGFLTGFASGRASIEERDASRPKPGVWY